MRRAKILVIGSTNDKIAQNGFSILARIEFGADEQQKNAMTKPTPQTKADNDSEFVERVKKDVEKTGFPLEILSAGLFHDAGWIAVDHAYYMDQDENKGREIDLFAIKSFFAQNSSRKVELRIGLSVEIKKSTGKPWVVLTSERRNQEEIAGIFDTMLIRMHHEEIWFRDLYSNHHVAAEARLGRTCYQSLAKQENDSTPQRERYNDATPFSAFVSAFKATRELISIYRNQTESVLRDETGRKTYGVGIAHGLVILKGDLFEARVNKNGDVTVNRSNYIPYLFNYASEKYGYRSRLVDIVTLDGLPSYIKKYDEWGAERATFCLNQL